MCSIPIEIRTFAPWPITYLHSSTREPFPEITERVLKVDDVAKLLQLSTWKVYESIRLGEIPSIRVGRRVLIPTHALRGWLSKSASDKA